ncbi:MAG: 3' terminal RNA ribose 2'-O-methyltransferase Hen1 [Acidobacteriota bacterium]
MLLHLSTTYRPATDLGYLLGKHPDRVHSRPLPWGRGLVFFPEASEDRASAALLVEVDPVGLVRRRRNDGLALRQYVNDRPYAASSFLSVAISRCLGSALSGRCRDRPELAERRLPFEVEIPAVPCRGGEDRLRQLFEPLGYGIGARRLPLDPNFPDWGESQLFSVTLSAEQRLQDLLSHLYVLLPVLDDDKHYWVSEPEVQKLLRHGDEWLADHPAKEDITYRYLRHGRLARQALSTLSEPDLEEHRERLDVGAASEAQSQQAEQEEATLEKPIRLHDLRLDRVRDVLKSLGARRVLDLGCGGGQLLQRLFRDPFFESILGVDISTRSLERAERRLKLERQSDRQKKRIKLIQGALTYHDRRLQGFDAAALVEVIEHVEPSSLDELAAAVFQTARPRAVVITTPNAEYNVRFESLPAGNFRHADHRFEWTRAEFSAFAHRIAETHGYRVEIEELGPVDPEVGAPSQLGIFRR